ncbi:MAG: glycosyltransferase family 4 protein [Patescibacteria group bacterium]
MKIAHICPFYYPSIGGVEKVVEELAKRQIKNGDDVHVYTSDWDKNSRIELKEEVVNNVHIHRCFHWFKISKFGSFWPSVFFKLLKEDFDIVHVHVSGHAHIFFASLYAKLKHIGLVHTTHCPWTDNYRPLYAKILLFFSYNIFGRISFKWTDKIIAITPWEIQFIKKYGGENIIVIPNGVDNVFFNKIMPNNFKKKYKIKKKLVLFFGRLNITKGPEKFVETAKEILKERQDICFLMRGPDEGMREEVKKSIKSYKDIILLEETRNRKEVVEMYQAADLYVLPSFREGLPLTLFEAMAAGLPIVASPVNGIPYEMKDPENGFLVEYGDIKNLKERIIKLLDNKKLAAKISVNNINKAKKYKWDDIEKRYYKEYKTLLN